MIVALGSNLAGRGGSSRVLLDLAVRRLRRAGLEVYRISPWVSSAPVPRSAQAMFINGIVCVRTALGPDRLLKVLLEIEREFGRIRLRPNAARTLDLDLIAYGDMVCGTANAPALVIPHPRAHRRSFVLQPLRLALPAWRHPVLGETAAEFLKNLPLGPHLGAAFPVSRPLRGEPGRLKKNVRPKKTQGAAAWPA